MVPIKRRLNNKLIGVTCKALKDLEKKMTNRDVAAKYGVPKSILSIWVKNKHKLTTSLEKKGMFSKRGDEICTLLLNMESLFVRERIDDLKQSVVTNFFKKK